MVPFCISTKLALSRARTTESLARMIVFTVEMCKACGIMMTENKTETMCSPSLHLDVPCVNQSLRTKLRADVARCVPRRHYYLIPGHGHWNQTTRPVGMATLLSGTVLSYTIIQKPRSSWRCSCQTERACDPTVRVRDVFASQWPLKQAPYDPLPTSPTRTRHWLPVGIPDRSRVVPPSHSGKYGLWPCWGDCPR